MARERLVAVSYPVDDEFTEINISVLGAEADLAFLAELGEQARRQTLLEADALIGWRLDTELPDGALAGSSRLEFIQLLPAGADAVDFTAIPDRLVLASNVGAYAKPIAEHLMAMTLALARRLPQRQAAMASVMAMMCSAMGLAYAPTLLATAIRSGMAAKSTVSAPAGSSWMNSRRGDSRSTPAGSSRPSRQPISASASRTAWRRSCSPSRDAKAISASALRTLVLISANWSSTG